LQTQEKPNETKHFFELKKLLQKHPKAFAEAELRDLYEYAINYCLRRVNAGQLDFLKELFSLYKETLEAGLLFEDEQLSFWTYKNIVGVALRLREFLWAEALYATIIRGWRRISGKMRSIITLRNYAFTVMTSMAQ